MNLANIFIASFTLLREGDLDLLLRLSRLEDGERERLRVRPLERERDVDLDLRSARVTDLAWYRLLLLPSV